jgi:putative ABC transport system ATP-binding protein
VNLVRCLVKRPDILVVDGALAPFDENRSQEMMQMLLELLEQQSLFMVLPNNRQAGAFDVQMQFRDGQIFIEKTAGPARAVEPRKPEVAPRIAGEVA